MLVHENFDGKYECTTEGRHCRIAERDWRDRRDEVGIYSVHVALHAPRAVALADFFSILPGISVSNRV
jgi:hypothetical protein